VVSISHCGCEDLGSIPSTDIFIEVESLFARAETTPPFVKQDGKGRPKSGDLSRLMESRSMVGTLLLDWALGG
jgi:hypothetical protein